MTKIATFFIENNKFTLVLTIGLIIFGLSSLYSLKSESFPTVNIGSVIIETQYPGASAEDIESKITKPLEDEIRKVRGLKDVKSVSQSGNSRIVTVVDIDKYDVDEVISDLQRAVDRTPSLPSDLPNPPSFLEVKTEEFPVIELAVIGSNDKRFRDRVAFEVKEELEDNKDIASITLTGYTERQLSILLDKEKLRKNHVSIGEVSQKIQLQNVNIPGGNIETKDSQKIIRIEGKLKTTQELENLVIRSNFSGKKILLKDLGSILDSNEDPRTLALYQNEPATLITIAKKGGTDIIKLSEEVKRVLGQFREKYSERIQLTIYNDEGLRVGNRVQILSSNGMVGLLLVVVFLIIFLPGRPGIMAALSLPLAVMATFGYMSAAGFSINTITILALVISIGMLVDNAVVISENFARLKSNGIEPKKAAISTIRDLWFPISATALTTIAAFLPMLVTKGIIGQFIKGIPIVVTAALVISLIESFFLLPTRLVGGNKTLKVDPGGLREDWFSARVTRPFSKFVRWLIYRKYVTALLFLGIILGSIFMIAEVNKFVLFPADQTEIYVSRVEMPEGTPIEVTQSKMAEIADIAKKELATDVLHIASRVGLSEMDFGDPKSRRGENVGIIYYFMTEDAKNNLKTNDVLKRLRKIEVDGLKDLSFEALINGPPIGAPVTAIFRSNSVDRIDEVTEKIMSELNGVDGVFDVRVDDVYGADELHLKIDQKAAGRLGLDLATLGATVRMAVAGERIADVNIDNKKVNYFLRFQDTDRMSANQLKEIKIMDQRGNLISIDQVVSIEKKSASPQIKRYDFKKAKTVTANIDDNIITAVKANAIVASTFGEIADEYKDVTIDFGGEGERTQESMESLFQALILSIIGIFALLVLLFKSYVRPIIILTTIPLGLVGVAISFWVHGRPISFLALIGVVGLGGIIVNSGIVLISFIEQLRKESDKPLDEVLIQAASLRLRAVVVTSLTTVCGLLPTAYGIGGADEFIIPLTMAMAWGLTSGTVLALLWVPCAYAITEDISNFTAKAFSKTKSPLRPASAPGKGAI